jgi:hypothetical protein
MWRRIDPDPTVISIFDGYGYIVPLEALTADAKLGTVSVVGTYDFDTFTVPPRRTLQLPAGHVVVDLAYAEAGRRAKFYRLTRSGRRRLEQEKSEWRVYVGAVEAVLQAV